MMTTGLIDGILFFFILITLGTLVFMNRSGRAPAVTMKGQLETCRQKMKEKDKIIEDKDRTIEAYAIQVDAYERVISSLREELGKR